MSATPPLTADALLVLAAAFLATSSPKRLRRMRDVVKNSCCCTTGSGAVPIKPNTLAAHALVILALERAEMNAEQMRRVG